MRTTDCAQLGLGAERIHLRWISETPASSARSIINHSTAIHNSRSTGEKKVELLVGVRERGGRVEGPRGVSTPAEEPAFDVSWWTFPVCPSGTNDWDKVAVGIYNDGPRASWILSSAPETRSLLWFIVACTFSFFQRVVRLFESDFRRGFDGV